MGRSPTSATCMTATKIGSSTLAQHWSLRLFVHPRYLHMLHTRISTRRNTPQVTWLQVTPPTSDSAAGVSRWLAARCWGELHDQIAQGSSPWIKDDEDGKSFCQKTGPKSAKTQTKFGKSKHFSESWKLQANKIYEGDVTIHFKKKLQDMPLFLHFSIFVTKTDIFTTIPGQVARFDSSVSEVTASMQGSVSISSCGTWRKVSDKWP